MSSLYSRYRYKERVSMFDTDQSNHRYRLGHEMETSCNEEIFNIFKEKDKLSASDFRNVWQHYDKDMSGFIEAEELELFLSDLFKAQGHSFTYKEELASLRMAILECYDENQDGKIEVLEMTKFLPVEDNFLLHFRIKGTGRMTCGDFIAIWKHYDTDKSGFLEKKELGYFLTDLLKINQNIIIQESEMENIVTEIMKNFDENNDGMIEFSEMKKILNVEDNVLTEMSLNKKLTTQQFNTIFDYYDSDHSNFLEGEEIKEFIKDLMERAGTPLPEEMQTNHEFYQAALKLLDKDNDGKISREELASFLYTDTSKPHKPKSPNQKCRRTKSKKSKSPGKSHSPNLSPMLGIIRKSLSVRQEQSEQSPDLDPS